MRSSVSTIPFFESASFIWVSFASLTKLRFAAARLVTGVDFTSSVSLFFTVFAFFGDNGVFLAGDFYGKKQYQIN